MVKNREYVSKCLMFLALLCVILQSEVGAQNEASLIKKGDAMPSFQLESADGVINSEDLKGKVVLINFFATWCPPCRKELPHIQNRIWSKYKDNPKFKLLIVGRNHTLKEMATFKAEKFDLPFYPDKDRKMYSQFALNTIPRNYVVNKKGKVVYDSIGFSLKDFEEMIQILEAELDKN